MSQAVLTAAIEPYLPIAYVVHWGAGGRLAGALIQRIEASLKIAGNDLTGLDRINFYDISEVTEMSEDK